jgi:hypothetical protein
MPGTIFLWTAEQAARFEEYFQNFTRQSVIDRLQRASITVGAAIFNGSAPIPTALSVVPPHDSAIREAVSGKN